MIETKSLTYQYPQSDHTVLEDVNFKITPGSLTLVAGSSGSGKSTLLRCINGLVPHFTGGIIAGDIKVFGHNPIHKGPEFMARHVGFVFQEPEAQFVFDRVEDEIAFVLENFNTPRETMKIMVNEIIENMGLATIRYKKINEISGGEKQMVSIASALVMRPDVLVLDEPTSQLDPHTADEILQFIISIKSQLNLTVVVAEHRLERLLPYIDQIVYLSPEKKFYSGYPEDILPIMHIVPPIVKIAERFKLSPLPLTIEAFHTQVPFAKKLTNRLQTPDQSNESEDVLEISDLSVSLDNRQILENVSIKLKKSEIFTLMGPNGSGKTTLLRSVFNLIPGSGKIRLRGQNISNLSLSDVIENIAYLPQNPNDLLFAETVMEELIITLKNHDKFVNPESISFFLSQFGLGDKDNHYPRDLSVGERQRTALAAITVHDPHIIFLDEPTRGLDYVAKQALSEFFRSWRDQGKTILLVTHDIEFAAGLADRVAILDKGKIQFTGSPREAFTDYEGYRSQTASLFPNSGWIIPDEVSV